MNENENMKSMVASLFISPRLVIYVVDETDSLLKEHVIQGKSDDLLKLFDSVINHNEGQLQAE